MSTTDETLSTIDETAIIRFSTNCHRCGGTGHWADSPGCPWLKKAASSADHQKRIDSLRDRYTEFQITDWHKQQYIRFENKLWYDGKVPSAIALGESVDTDLGEISYTAYLAALNPGQHPELLPAWDTLTPDLQAPIRAGAQAVADHVTGKPAEQYALAGQMGHRRITGAVRETEFCGRPMLEVTDLTTGTVHLVSTESLYALTWLTEDQAHRITRTGSHAPAAIAPSSSTWADEDDEDQADDDPYIRNPTP